MTFNENNKVSDVYTRNFLGEIDEGGEGADCHKCRPQTEVENNVFDSVSGKTTLYLEMTKTFKGEYEIIDINLF